MLDLAGRDCLGERPKAWGNSGLIFMDGKKTGGKSKFLY
jgi:hypothetical protein